MPYGSVEIFKQAYENWGKAAKGDWGGLKDNLLNPSRWVKQAKSLGDAGPAPALIPDLLPEELPQAVGSTGKWIKYAAIGGVALLAYSVLKK